MKNKLFLVLFAAPLLLTSCGGSESNNSKEAFHELVASYKVSDAQTKYASGKEVSSGVLTIGVEPEEGVKAADLFALTGFSEHETVEKEIANADFASYMMEEQKIAEVEELVKDTTIEVTYEISESESSVYVTVSESNHKLGDYEVGYAQYTGYFFNEVGLLTKVDHSYGFAQQSQDQTDPTITFAFREIIEYTWTLK